MTAVFDVRQPDYLVSICLVEEGRFDEELSALAALATACDSRLRYWEIIYVIRETSRAMIEAASARLSGLKNVRIVVVNRGVSHYRGRELAASEAIGDVIVISAFSEVAAIDVVGLADKALSSGEIVIARKAGLDLSLFHVALRVLSPYRVDSTDLRTIALPRLKLAMILARPTSAIDLRFEAKRGMDRYVRHLVDASAIPRNTSISRRMDLALEIVSSSAPRFLKGYAIMSLGMVALSGFYSAYAVLVYIFDETVQPGWFSNTIVLSGSVGYLALGFAIVSLGLARLAEQVGRRDSSPIIDEIGNINFFASTERLNVAMTSGGEPS